MSKFRLVFNVLSVIFFVIVGYLVLFSPSHNWSETGRAGVAFLSAVFCALIGNLDTIEWLKASLSGIEAKTREAEKAAESARVALTEFHVLAEMTGALLIELIAGGGRFGGGPSDHQDERRGRIIETLKKIGLSAEAVKRVNAGDKFFVSIDYSLGILNRISKSEACSPELKKLAAEWLTRWNNENFRPTPDDFAKLFEETPCGDPEIANLLEDYRYYRAHEEHRRPDVWNKRHAWHR